MEDYSVGSLSELISGKKSKNKAKIIKTEVAQEKVSKKQKATENVENRQNAKKGRGFGDNPRHNSKPKHKTKDILSSEPSKSPNVNKGNKGVVSLPSEQAGQNNRKRGKNAKKKSKRAAEIKVEETIEEETVGEVKEEQGEDSVVSVGSKKKGKKNKNQIVEVNGAGNQKKSKKLENKIKVEIKEEEESDNSSEEDMEIDDDEFEKTLKELDDDIGSDESDEDDSEKEDNEDSDDDSKEDESEDEEKEGDDSVLSKAEIEKRELEHKTRTIFVGNFPVKVPKKNIQKLFKKFGVVETVRLRSVPVNDTRVSKKVAMIKKDFHPDRTSLHCYVRFATRKEALKAVEANGMVFRDHHLRINMADTKASHDEAKAIFVGNVPFDAEDEELYKIFESCGEITSVRLVRDPRTLIGKGFGYVNFASSDSVELALQMDEIKLKKRTLRIKRCEKSTNKGKKRPREFSEDGETTSKKPKSEKKSDFRGKTFDRKKHKRTNYQNNRKKKLAEQLAPKPKEESS